MTPEAKALEIVEFDDAFRLLSEEQVDRIHDAITQALRDVERETLERAAKIAEDYQAPGEEFGCDDWSDDTLSRQADIAQSIRSLINSGREGEI